MMTPMLPTRGVLCQAVQKGVLDFAVNVEQNFIGTTKEFALITQKVVQHVRPSQ
jgi:hypothetical protein